MRRIALKTGDAVTVEGTLKPAFALLPAGSGVQPGVADRRADVERALAASQQLTVFMPDRPRGRRNAQGAADATRVARLRRRAAASGRGRSSERRSTPGSLDPVCPGPRRAGHRGGVAAIPELNRPGRGVARGRRGRARRRPAHAGAHGLDHPGDGAVRLRSCAVAPRYRPARCRCAQCGGADRRAGRSRQRGSTGGSQTRRCHRAGGRSAGHRQHAGVSS